MLTVIIGVVALAGGFAGGFLYRKKVSEKEISSAEEEGRRIVNEAIRNAESKKKEALLEAKEEILKTSRVLIQQNGWEAVNIRAVAAACGVSVGCIYNYFGSKTELVSAAVESIWSDIFRHPDDPAVFEDTLSCIRWMYRQMEYGSEQYPGFFTHHALGFVRQDTADGKQQMRQTWQHILDALTMVLPRDKKSRPDAFTEEFSRQKFAGILFSLMLSAVVQQDFDPTAVLEIIRRTIYEV